MPTENELRLNISLDEQAKQDLTDCTVAVALERDGEGITHSKVIRMALRRWAATLDIPGKPKRGSR